MPDEQDSMTKRKVRWHGTAGSGGQDQRAAVQDDHGRRHGESTRSQAPGGPQGPVGRPPRPPQALDAHLLAHPPDEPVSVDDVGRLRVLAAAGGIDLVAVLLERFLQLTKGPGLLITYVTHDVSMYIRT